MPSSPSSVSDSTWYPAQYYGYDSRQCQQSWPTFEDNGSHSPKYLEGMRLGSQKDYRECLLLIEFEDVRTTSNILPDCNPEKRLLLLLLLTPFKGKYHVSGSKTQTDFTVQRERQW